MVGAAVVLKKLETDDARVVAAVGGEMLKQFGAIVFEVGRQIDMRYDEKLVGGGLAVRGGCKRPDHHDGHHQYSRDEAHPIHCKLLRRAGLACAACGKAR